MPQAAGKKPNWRGGRHARRGHLPGRVDISEHPAAPMTEALLRRLGPHRDRAHTMTADNGKEFAGRREVSAGLEAGFCFATPCHSRERGLNETANGLVRECFPKGTDFRQVTAEQVRQVECWLNRRPRKSLSYRTPHEVFHEGLALS